MQKRIPHITLRKLLLGITLALAVVLLIMCTVWIPSGIGGPVYKGKDLSAWLAEYAKSDILYDPEEHLQGSEESEAAIRALGTDSSSYLLKLAEAHDSNLRKRIVSTCRGLGIRMYTDGESHRMACAGFHVIQPAAAVPKLIMLLGSEHPDIRATATVSLGEIGPRAEEAVPTLLRQLTNNDSFIQAYTLLAMRRISRRADVAVPALTRSLEASNSVSSDGAGLSRLKLYALGSYGMQARSASPAIVPFLTDNDPLTREVATNTLAKINAQER